MSWERIFTAMYKGKNNKSNSQIKREKLKKKEKKKNKSRFTHYKREIYTAETVHSNIPQV